jgi:hypothetical protein
MIWAMFSRNLISLSTILLLSICLSCNPDEPRMTGDQVSSRSYKGHEDDSDANNLVAAYPSLVGTRLDDCQSCHSGTIVDGVLAGSSCDHCHDLVLHGTGHEASETLNPFGRDYMAAGRSEGALVSIKEKDSDGDGFSNDEELQGERYPGSGLSMPGQAVATLITVTLEELRALPSHSQFMLVNATQQQFDDYVTFQGVKIKDLLASLNIDSSGATGITLIAPDGYMKSLPIEFVTRLFPQPVLHAGLDVETLGPGCGVVRYPETMPEGLSDGSPIPGEQWLILAYERNGEPLDTANLEASTGRIIGEGPLRVVVPQENPGKPDRGSGYSPSGCNDGLDFQENADHNAGAMVRGVIAIRIDPMPEGFEEFDYKNGGWAYVQAGQLILYGHGVG